MTTTTDRAPAAGTATDVGRERIVLAAGGDLAAYAAARWVARRAGQHPIDLTLVATDDEGIDGERIDRTADVLRDAVPDWETRILVSGGGRHAVVEAARHCDLLVLGSNRVSALARRLPSTTSVQIAEEARCPVVLVPSGWEPGAGRIVVGVSLDGSDEAALRFAIAEADALRRELAIVHVWHLSDVVTPVFAFALDESPIRAEHAARLEALLGRVRAANPSLRVIAELVHGEARTQLERHGTGAELVVVGSHGRSSIERILLGSVERYLAERPPGPVAFVPPRYLRAESSRSRFGR